MSKDINLEKTINIDSKQIQDCLIYNAVQLNQHLSEELSSLQNKKVSKITTKVINLSMSTAVISELAFSKLSDTNTIIQNRVSH
ncbi:hypothetical protein JNUCC83_05430 [Vagococcus sp. JNUCC 83]